MSDLRPDETPQAQPASAGSPPRPPKRTARGLGEDSPEGRSIELPDPIVLKDLASALGQRPFNIVADVMESGQFKSLGDFLEFDVAARVAKKYGFIAARAN